MSALPIDLGPHLEAQLRRDLHRRRHRRRGGTAAALTAVGLLTARTAADDTPTATSAVLVPRPSERAGQPAATGAAPSSAAATSATAPSTTTLSTPPIGPTPDPASLTVLVDRHRPLPEDWEPTDLVASAVPFTFSGHDPKRLLRPEAATALEALFAAATAAGLPLAGVSGYRSAATQEHVHAASVARHGPEAAGRFSARPRHSEHQAGLAIDVTGADGACPASACFADRPEADWLARHAHRFGFLVRYPSGAEATTGYGHEPWHLRYVGREVAEQVHRHGTTFDEFLGAGEGTS